MSVFAMKENGGNVSSMSLEMSEYISLNLLLFYNHVLLNRYHFKINFSKNLRKTTNFFYTSPL